MKENRKLQEAVKQAIAELGLDVTKEQLEAVDFFAKQGVAIDAAVRAEEDLSFPRGSAEVYKAAVEKIFKATTSKGREEDSASEYFTKMWDMFAETLFKFQPKNSKYMVVTRGEN